MSQEKGPNGWVLFAVFGGILVVLLLGGLVIRGIGFGPLLILFDRPTTTGGPVPPEVTNQPPPTGAPPPSPQPQAATLPPAYNGQWAGRGGIPGDTTLHTDFVLTLTGGEARAEVGTLQTETNGMPCRTSLQLVEVDADQVVLSGDCGGGDFIVLKVNGKNMDYYGGVQANTSWYAISASLRRR